MNKAQALYSFWSSFGWPAYDEYTVPSTATLPYITYSTGTSNFGNQMQLGASLWYVSGLWTEIEAKKDEIADALGIGGITIPFDGGLLWIKPGTNFAQRMGDETDKRIRRYVLQVEVEYFSQT